VKPEELLRGAWREVLAQLRPVEKVSAMLRALPQEWARRPRYVMAVGKAASLMLAGATDGGWVRAVAVGPKQAVEPWHREAPPAPDAVALGPVTALVGAHPLPDASSVAAAGALEALVAEAPRSALLLALVSGGGSAMVARPRDGVTLEEKIAATRETMAAGASIAELNALRRSLSAVKGGRLVERAAAPVLTLLLSDVADDDPRTIASGLTISAAARPLDEGWPPPDELEGDARRADRYVVLAGQDAAARAAAEALAMKRWIVERRSEPLVSDVAVVAEELASAARWACAQGRRVAIVAHGEPTVRLPAGADAVGEGGRAQQLALLLAAKLEGLPVTALVAGTDGVDGPSQPPVAGAIVSGRTWSALAKRGIDGAQAIARCDARPQLAAIDALLSTGPTGLNHADVMILLCEPAA
jgi:glycerate 2-kinase